jgi:hypothetical protein
MQNQTKSNIALANDGIERVINGTLLSKTLCLLCENHSALCGLKNQKRINKL